jgi:hypothetical protein
MGLPQIKSGTTVDELYRQLQQGVPIVDGQTVAIDAAASTAVQSARHGLGRVYRGGWVVLGPSANVVLRVLDPAGQADPATYLYFQLSGAAACTAKVWTF